MNVIDEQLVYCMTCKHTVAREEAQVAFHTGFYKARYRLGQCKCCFADSLKKDA